MCATPHRYFTIYFFSIGLLCLDDAASMLNSLYSDRNLSSSVILAHVRAILFNVHAATSS